MMNGFRFKDREKLTIIRTLGNYKFRLYMRRAKEKARVITLMFQKIHNRHNSPQEVSIYEVSNTVKKRMITHVYR